LGIENILETFFKKLLTIFYDERQVIAENAIIKIEPPSKTFQYQAFTQSSS